MNGSSPACTASKISSKGPNGDESDFPDRIGNFHKGLPHNDLGEVDPAAYDTLLDATSPPPPASPPSEFQAITLGLGRKLTNPQAGLANDLEGPDPEDLEMRSPPSVDSAEAAAEAVELYWMALLRDVPFESFPADAEVARAAEELSGLDEFTGPKAEGAVTPQTIFRGCTPGDLTGPYLSQFLLRDIPYGSLTLSQRQTTVVPGSDFLTDFDEWLAIQNGRDTFPPDQFDETPRYIRNMRDLGQYVHVDALYEAYLNACLILLAREAPFDPGNPYRPPNPDAEKQEGFGTFGGPHVLSLVTEVATRALKAVWYQKWFVHRRLRPEAYGGLVHLTKTGRQKYPVHPQVLSSDAVADTRRRHGSYLLPMAFPEGSPTHPSYGAGHGTVAGACVTILKAWFDEDHPMPDPVVADADGEALVPYTGPGAGSLTVGGELNKVAANIALGRNMAGVHWRSDYLESLRLGEQVAICILFRQRNDYNEEYSFSLTGFDGDRFEISRSGVVKNGRRLMKPCR